MPRPAGKELASELRRSIREPVLREPEVDQGAETRPGERVRGEPD